MPEKRLFAIVLAAGASQRFGSVKQLQEINGIPLVRRAVRLGENLCGARTVLVAGHESSAVVDACAPLRGFFVHNSQYRKGLSTSIASGIRAVASTADAVLLLLADQPLVTPAHLDRLAAAWSEEPGSIVATAFAETLGPPAIFPRRYFEELCALKGDSGARALLSTAARRVEFENAAVDVDTPADLDALAADFTEISGSRPAR